MTKKRSRRRVVRIVLGVFLSILALFLTAISGVYAYFTRSLPTMQGEIEDLPVRAPVDVYRDSYGIPHVYAKNYEDLFFVQGYIQAMDRLFEMDLSRRAVRGRLAQIFGPDYVKTDQFLLTLGFMRDAEVSYAALSEETRLFLDRFTAGINAYIERHKGALPPEFTLLNYEPEPWTPLDSVAIGKYMSWTLGGNMQNELLNMALVDALGTDKAALLFPAYPKDGIEIMKKTWQSVGLDKDAALALFDVTLRTERGRLGVPGVGLGSNNWVVSGKLTTTGFPMLANDMHLEMKAPSIWVQQHLVVDAEPEGMNVTGVIFPGAPGIIVGHNAHLAWGVTNLDPDVQDLYIETRHPDDKSMFLYNGQYEKAKVYTYEIPVKGEEKPLTYTVTVTRHGPIISDVFEQSVPLALRWTNQEPTREIEAMIGFDRAKNLEEFKIALEKFNVPAQNFVVADKEGNIYYRANGLIPIRNEGNGLLPVPGDTERYEWKGFIPYSALPATQNPEIGFIVTANNQPIDDLYPYFLSADWAPPYRAEAITRGLQERLEKNGKLSFDDVLSMQLSTRNVQAERLAPVLIAALDRAALEGTAKEAYALLRTWLLNKPSDEADQVGPMIYYAFYEALLKETFLPVLQDEKLFERYLAYGHAINTMDRFLLEDERWFKDVLDLGEMGRERLLKDAFVKATDTLSETLGPHPATWRWGRLHTLGYKHPLGGVHPLLALVLNRGPYAVSGSPVVPMAASYPLSKPYEVTSSAPWRYGVSLLDMEGRDILFGGASGHPLSRHYADQLPLWRAGKYKPLLFERKDVETAAGQGRRLLRFLPPSSPENAPSPSARRAL
ncbi:MAG: penicillin acylase family protein [Candidatus Carbobacillus altaicus]|nr:penicillin acylase family protein [Candidatus Carbobacillus altaicus]